LTSILHALFGNYVPIEYHTKILPNANLAIFSISVVYLGQNFQTWQCTDNRPKLTRVCL